MVLLLPKKDRAAYALFLIQTVQKNCFENDLPFCMKLVKMLKLFLDDKEIDPQTLTKTFLRSKYWFLVIIDQK